MSLAKLSFSAHIEHYSFVRLRFAEFLFSSSFFFGKGKQAGSLPYLSHVFYKRDPSLFSHNPRWGLAKQEGILKCGRSKKPTPQAI